MQDIIQVTNLTKRYGDFTAVNGISFSVRTGETFGILGPNGAGKTTTLEMIEGLKEITTGTAVINGIDVKENARAAKQLIGVQLQSSSFFLGLNLAELIETFAALYGKRVDPMVWLKKVGLEEKARNQVKELSGGQKQRLSIAVGLVHDPKVLFLDEPTTGLDPQARRNLWGLVEEIKQTGTTIVLTTHYMEEAEVLCDRIAIMDNANIIALDTPKNLLKLSDVTTTIEFHTDKKITPSDLRFLPSTISSTVEDHRVVVHTNEIEQTLPGIFTLERQLGTRFHDLNVRQASLEDVFLKLTGKTLRD